MPTSHPGIWCWSLVAPKLRREIFPDRAGLLFRGDASPDLFAPACLPGVLVPAAGFEPATSSL